jgi:IclR family acetate operon transcriptional repressor
LYIDQAESPSSLRVTTGVGTLAPLYCTALGKALLAFASAPIPERLQAYTPRTITDHSLLQRHLDVVRDQGYAVDDEEFEIGVRCIAVPVYNFNDQCEAAIGVSGPTSRLTLENLPKMTEAVLEIGKALSGRLSFMSE